MVDLPTVSNQIVTSTAPQSSITSGAIEQEYNQRAAAYGKVADTLMDVSTDLAKKQAADDLMNQKVTRNADGSVNVENPASAPLIFGDAGEAYSNAVKVGTIAQHANSLSQDFANLHTQFPTDPTAFKAAADAHLAKTAQTIGGPIGEAVQQEGQQLLTQHYNAITSTAASNDVENQKKSITAQIEDQKNTAIALARQNGADSPEFKQAVAKMNLSYDALATNPLFKTPQDQIDIEKKNTAALLQGEAVVAHVDATYNKRGKAQASEELQTLLTNPDMREVDRSRLYTQGMARLAYLTADAKVNVDANRQITTQLEEGLAKGTIKAEDPAVGLAVQRSRAIGDTEGAQRITAAAAMQQHLRGVNSLPDSVKGDVLLSGSKVDLGRMQAAILGQESGNRSNIGNSIDGAHGPGQIMPATFAQYAKPGESIDSPADNRAVNARILADYSQRFNGDPARIAVAYFSGPGNVAPAGSPTPYLHDAKDGNGKSTSGYVSDVLKRLGPDAGAPAANGGPPFTAEQVQQNPFLISAYVRTLAADPELRVQSAKATAEASIKSLDNGILPSPAAYAEVRQAGNLYPDKMGKVADDLQGRMIDAQKILQVPEDQRSQLIEAYKRAADGADVHHQNIANAALDQIQKQNKNMVEHPYQEAAQRGWTAGPPAPIDSSQPDTIAPALVQRASLGNRIAGLNHTPAPPLLDKDEVPKLQAALQGPQGAQLLGQIGQALRPDEMQRLIDGDGFKESVTAMSRSGDPAKMNAAYSFMDTLQRQNPLQFDREFPEGLKDLRAWQSNLAFYPPDEAAKRLMRQYDPAQSAALKAADQVADAALKNVSPDKVVSKFSTGFGPFGTGARSPVSDQAGLAAGALKADYDKNYRDGFAATGDPTAADKFAMEKLGLKYAVSPANGNRVMANAPERYYPEVAGSHDWIGQQLDHDIAAATGAAVKDDKFDPFGIRAAGADFDRMRGLNPYSANRAIVPDKVTETDIANKKPPSYQIVLQDPATGRWGAMMDAAGQPRRIRFDPSTAFAAHAAAAEAARSMLPHPEEGGIAGAVMTP